MSTLNVEAISHPTSGSLVTINGAAPSNRNLIINGAMQVAQRGTSQASVTSTTYAGPDRFQHILGTAGTWTVSQSTEAPEGFATSLKLDCTTANASLSASSLYLLGQKIEGLNVQHLDYNTVNAKTVTLSFWVRSNKTGTYVCEVTTHTSTRKISQTYTINSANTWEKKILQIPGDTGGSLPNTNTAEFNVYWWLVAGANWKSGTLNTTWGITADNNRVVGQTVNLADSTANEFYLTGVQLEVGTVATPFEHRSYGDELARCQRYFERRNLNDNGNTEGIFGIGNSISTSSSKLLYYWNIEKRSSASISLTLDGGVLYVRDAFNSSQGTNQSFTVEATSSSHAVLTFTSNGGTFTAGAPGQVRVDQLGSGNAYFSISAEL